MYCHSAFGTMSPVMAGRHASLPVLLIHQLHTMQKGEIMTRTISRFNACVVDFYTFLMGLFSVQH